MFSIIKIPIFECSIAVSTLCFSSIKLSNLCSRSPFQAFLYITRLLFVFDHRHFSLRSRSPFLTTLFSSINLFNILFSTFYSFFRKLFLLSIKNNIPLFVLALDYLYIFLVFVLDHIFFYLQISPNTSKSKQNIDYKNITISM